MASVLVTTLKWGKKKKRNETMEVAQLVKYLSRSIRIWVQCFSTGVKGPSVLAHVCNPSPGETEITGPLKLMRQLF